MTAKEMLAAFAGEQAPGLNLWQAVFPVWRQNAGSSWESSIPALRTAAEFSGESPSVRPALTRNTGANVFLGKTDAQIVGNAANPLFQALNTGFFSTASDAARKSLSRWQGDIAEISGGGIVRNGNVTNLRLRMGDISETAVLLSALKESTGKSSGVDTERIFAELERRLAVELGAG